MYEIGRREMKVCTVSKTQKQEIKEKELHPILIVIKTSDLEFIY